MDEDDLSFIAEDGSNPVDYFERTVMRLRQPGTGRFASWTNPEDPVAFATAVAEAGIYLLEQIKARTREGQSFNGTTFVPYNDEYLKFKQKMGKNTDVVNLNFTGTMLGLLQVKLGPKGRNFEIGVFDDVRNATKAKIHNEGAFFALVHHPGTDLKIRQRFDPVRHKNHAGGTVFIPARPFLGFTQADLDRAAEIIATFKPGDAPVNANPYGFTEEELAMDQEGDISILHSGPRKKKKGRRENYDY